MSTERASFPQRAALTPNNELHYINCGIYIYIKSWISPGTRISAKTGLTSMPNAVLTPVATLTL